MNKNNSNLISIVSNFLLITISIIILIELNDIKIDIQKSISEIKNDIKNIKREISLLSSSVKSIKPKDYSNDMKLISKQIEVSNEKIVLLTKTFKDIMTMEIPKPKKQKKSIPTYKKLFKKLQFVGTIDDGEGNLNALVYFNNPNNVKTLKIGKYIFKIWEVVEIEKDKIIFQNYKTKKFFIKKINKTSKNL